jgi:hypothetical protein
VNIKDYVTKHGEDKSDLWQYVEKTKNLMDHADTNIDKLIKNEEDQAAEVNFKAIQKTIEVVSDINKNHTSKFVEDMDKFKNIYED